MNEQLSILCLPNVLTVYELRRLADELSMRHWGVRYSGGIELVKSKWKNLMASYYPYNAPQTPFIRMSSYVNARMSYDEVVGTLLHELVHWRLHTTGKRYKDEDEEFVSECMRVGAPFSGAASAKRAVAMYGKTKERRGRNERVHRKRHHDRREP